MKLFVIIVMFLIGSSVSVAQDSPNPVPSPGKDSQPVQEPGAYEHQKADTPDAGSKNLSFPHDRQYSAAVGKPDVHGPGDDPSPPPSDERIVWLTGVLAAAAVIQLLIYGKQAYYMNEGLKVTRQSTKAAQDSANAALIQAKIMESRERPWIMVIPDNPESGYPVGGTQPFPFQFKWLAKNVGSSPAFLTELYVTAGMGDLPIPNQELPYRKNPEAFAKFILPPDGAHESRARMRLSPEEIEGYVSGQKCIVFYGLIKYDDARGDPHRTRFCCYWEKQTGANRFHPVGPPNTVEYT